MKALDDVFASGEPTQERTAVDSAPPPASTREPKRQPAKKLDKLSLDFDLDGLGGGAKPTMPKRAPAASRPRAAAPKPTAAAPPATRPATKPGPPPGGKNRPPAPGRPRPPLRPPAATRAEPGTEPGVGEPRSPAPPTKRPMTKPGIPPPGRRPARPPARPGAPPARPPPPNRGAAGKPGPARASTVTDDKVRELHARLVDAKRQTRDAKGVSVDGLARSLRATERQLRQKHGNREIDFDVVIRDGKAVLKPTIK